MDIVLDNAKNEAEKSQSQSQLIAMIQKGNKKAALELSEAYKIDSLNTKEDEKQEDINLYNYESMPEEQLLVIHQHTNWQAPSYFLRKKHITRKEQISEETLIALVQSKSEKAKKELFFRYSNLIEKAPDEVLVMMVQEGNQDAFNLLVERYLPYVKKLIKKLERKYFFRGLDSNDLVQEGVLGFFKAKDDFKIERKTRFKDFSKHVIEKHMGTLILRSANYKNKVLNESFSYHSPIGSDSEITFEQLLKSETGHPEETAINRETLKDLKGKLTDLEEDVLNLYAMGLSYQEIGEIVGKQKKAIDNTIQRIRKKGKQYMSAYI